MVVFLSAGWPCSPQKAGCFTVERLPLLVEGFLFLNPCKQPLCGEHILAKPALLAKSLTKKIVPSSQKEYNTALFLKSMSKPFYSKKEQQKIAEQRITTLFQQAEQTFSKDAALAHRYVSLARKMAMRLRLRMPKEYKRKFCRYCYHFLMPGANARMRTREGKVIISCLDCKKFMRIPMR